VGTEFGWEQRSSNTWENPTFEDYEYNGQYCMSGLAFPSNNVTAKCTKVHEVSGWNINDDGVVEDNVLWNEKLWKSEIDDKIRPEDDEPAYQCDPSDTDQVCTLWYYTLDPSIPDDQQEEFK